MPLVRMALTNYRCFAAREEIELRPVTVVLGRNNSGKSALVRAPLILSTGVRPRAGDLASDVRFTDGNSPLDLDAYPDLVETFTNLLHGHRPHSNLGVEFDCVDRSGRTIQLSATIQNIDEYQRQIVDVFELRTEGRLFRLQWAQLDPLHLEPMYRATFDDRTYQPVRVGFEGLFPLAMGDDAAVWRSDLLDYWIPVIVSFQEAFGTVRYLGPFREQPDRLFRLPSRTPRAVGVKGGDTAAILADDAVRNRRRLIGEINTAMAEHLPGWTVDVVSRGGLYSLVLKSRDDQEVAVSLADAGTGISQALPIFVQRALDLVDPPARPVLEVVEQPELHLHPGAHPVLADLYIQATARTDVRFLIETHSETLLLRLRRRVADGTIDPRQVAVYFVGQRDGVASTRRIEIDENGNLDYWPEGVFSEDYEETRALVRLQLDKGDSRAS